MRGSPGRLFARGNSRGNLWLGFEPGVFLKRLNLTGDQNDAIDRENAALDRMVKGICRGC